MFCQFNTCSPLLGYARFHLIFMCCVFVKERKRSFAWEVFRPLPNSIWNFWCSTSTAPQFYFQEKLRSVHVLFSPLRYTKSIVKIVNIMRFTRDVKLVNKVMCAIWKDDVCQTTKIAQVFWNIPFSFSGSI